VSHYEYSHIAHIDHLGGRRSAEDLPVDGLRIPFLGDSFTFGVGVADEETFVSRMNQESKTVLVNLGVPGSCLRDHLDILTQRHEELGRPQRYVFVFFIGNDLANLYVERTTKDEGSDNDLRPASQAGKVLQAMNDFIRTNRLLRKVYSVQYVKSKMLIAYNRYRESKGVIRRMDDEYFHMVQMTPQFGEMLNYLDEELARLADLQRDLNFHSLFLIIPDRHQVSSELLTQKLRYYGLDQAHVVPDLLNTELGQRLDAADIPYVDATACLRKHDGQDLYYTLDNHLTPRGHAVFHACIQKPLMEYLDL
jgi:lysophospholipase L1-like esterase